MFQVAMVTAILKLSLPEAKLQEGSAYKRVNPHYFQIRSWAGFFFYTTDSSSKSTVFGVTLPEPCLAVGILTFTIS